MPSDRRQALAQLEKDFGKPIIALPRGSSVEGRVVRIESQPGLLLEPGKASPDLAVVDTKAHLSILSVPAGSADHLLGQQVRLWNEHGRMMLNLVRRGLEIDL
jgi:hypothetical protein